MAVYLLHGLGQLRPEEMASLLGSEQRLDDTIFEFAVEVDNAFAVQDQCVFETLASLEDAPLPYVPAAVRRWLEERSDTGNGLGKLERLCLEVLNECFTSPEDILKMVAARDRPPQYWGDTTLWAKINGLAARNPPLVRIEGPTEQLPQWKGSIPLSAFKVLPL